MKTTNVTTNTVKIHGLKKAVGEYNRLNAGGAYSPHYGILMFDVSTGELWTDEFYDLSHSSCVIYQSDTIYNLSLLMRYHEPPVNMKNIREFINSYFN